MKARPILMHGRSIRSLLAGRKTQTRRIVKLPLGVIEEPGGLVHARAIYTDGTKEDYSELLERCPYGAPGNLLYARETWRVGAWRAGEVDTALRGECPVWGNDNRIAIDYAADDHCRREWLQVPDDELHERLVDQSLQDARAAGFAPDDDGRIRWQPGESPCRWRPSIHMPRWASRLTLHLTDVRVERIQEISESDAQAEGIEYRNGFYTGGLHPVKGTHKCMPTAYEAFRGLWDDTNGPGAWDRNDWVWVLEFDVIHENANQVMERLPTEEE